MDSDHIDIDTEDLPDLLAQLAAVALLELAARALPPPPCGRAVGHDPARREG